MSSFVHLCIFQPSVDQNKQEAGKLFVPLQAVKQTIKNSATVKQKVQSGTTANGSITAEKSNMSQKKEHTEVRNNFSGFVSLSMF